MHRLLKKLARQAMMGLTSFRKNNPKEGRPHIMNACRMETEKAYTSCACRAATEKLRLDVDLQRLDRRWLAYDLDTLLSLDGGSPSLCVCRLPDREG